MRSYVESSIPLILGTNGLMALKYSTLFMKPSVLYFDYALVLLINVPIYVGSLLPICRIILQTEENPVLFDLFSQTKTNHFYTGHYFLHE